MTRRSAAGLFVAVGVCGVVVAALARESGAVSRSPLPASTTSTATPQITPLEGSLRELNLAAHRATVSGVNGTSWVVALDPVVTTVWEGSQRSSLAQLKVGQRVKVRSMAKDGRPVARSIEIQP